MLDPWRTLGLEPGASTAEVKRAYRRLAKAFHPDAAGGTTLPRFLAIQQAYEALMAPRAPRTPFGRAGGASPGPAPRPAWQADPTRARASGGPRRGTRRSGPGPAGPTGADTAGRAGGTADGAERPRRQRRPAKRATFGSTTYDEVHEPAPEEGWAGASWYGTTSGEYWTVNPREYADPRKHGPEYLARARRGSPADDDRRAPGDAPRAAGPRPRGGRPSPRPPADDHPPAATSRPDAWPAADAAVPSMLPSLGLPDGHTRSGRLVLVLLAWPPLGLVAASLIGAATGCARYTAACGPGADLLPWFAQVGIVILLGLMAAMSPRSLRALATGTIAVIGIAVPATILLAAAGATYDPVRGPVALTVLLAIGWAGGIAFGALRARTIRR